ncbi:hypothetical protein BU14_1767s0001 [Porphyra umbilicalis]|uniref:Zinc transporter n=1 Tax=Porphyra umbilicalis TaxID=2786 RepID=A0A1X6NLH3_PORUM|nr:hypothetical protein BU14_1767s0001 [Porphyra umbilicalis]|eukprot:OSX69183.1 hypothetical protein BU14_1767s0001 [Porphyra umbilicalis]
MADTCTPDSSGSNVGAAFGLVAASGMATSLGAAAAFWMPLPKPGARSNPWLAASLGAAAGVMVYVSFVEIFAQKAVGAFQVCIDRSDLAYLYATLCFFGGVALTVAFDVALHAFERWAQRRLARRASTVDAEAEQGQAVPASDIFESDRAAVPTGGTSPDAITVVPVSADTGVSLSDTMGGGHLLATVAAGMEVDAEAARSGAAAGNSSHPSAGDSNWTEDGDADRSLGADAFESTDDKNRRVAMQALTDHHGVQLEPGVLDGAKAKKDLVRMGCFAGVALAAHNFPEGLATFIATLQDPSVGVSVAIAIGIHNIPEGIAVAMPIYYATGSKPKAFFWASLSGMTELFGAFLGWVVLRKVFNQLVYGILFGLISGMMVYIALKELLPTAHLYDPDDKVVTISLIGGMVVMAASLVLFQF